MSSGDEGQPGATGGTPAENPAQAPSPSEPPVSGPGPAAGPVPGAAAAPSAGPADAPTAESTPASGRVAEGEPAPERETIIDAVADLLQMIVNYLRQETAQLMRDKVVLPGQQLGMLIAFAFAAAALLVIGLCFIFVAVLLVLAHYLGWPAALALVGTLILIGAGVFTYLKVRSIQT